MICRIAVAVAGAVIFGLASPGAALAQDEKGKEVFANAAPKCKVCHSIGGEGNATGSLDDVGSKISPADIKAWLRTPREMASKAKAERKPPMPVYGPDKISDADLDALAAYLSSQKKK